MLLSIHERQLILQELCCLLTHTTLPRARVIAQGNAVFLDLKTPTWWHLCLGDNGDFFVLLSRVPTHVDVNIVEPDAFDRVLYWVARWYANNENE